MIKILILISFFCFSQEIECQRAKLDQPCYGECGSFLDKNSNTICDIWEVSHNDRSKNDNEILKKIKKARLIEIFSITIFFILLSEIIFKKSNTARLIWNWFLFISALISALSGFLLYFSIFEEIRKNLYTIHIQVSSFFFIISIYHTIKRFKCMIR